MTAVLICLAGHPTIGRSNARSTTRSTILYRNKSQPFCALMFGFLRYQSKKLASRQPLGLPPLSLSLSSFSLSLSPSPSPPLPLSPSLPLSLSLALSLSLSLCLWQLRLIKTGRVVWIILELGMVNWGWCETSKPDRGVLNFSAIFSNQATR